MAESKVIHVRSVGQDVTEEDVHQFAQEFGTVTKVVLLRPKNQVRQSAMLLHHGTWKRAFEMCVCDMPPILVDQWTLLFFNEALSFLSSRCIDGFSVDTLLK